jgi:hypothetical protein
MNGDDRKLSSIKRGKKDSSKHLKTRINEILSEQFNDDQLQDLSDNNEGGVNNNNYDDE